jgi:hypothetical protein
LDYFFHLHEGYLLFLFQILAPILQNSLAFLAFIHHDFVTILVLIFSMVTVAHLFVAGTNCSIIELATKVIILGIE